MAETLVHTLTVVGQLRLGAGIAAGSTATYDTPGGKSVTIQHLRPVGAELNFAISPAAVEAADFPSRIVATKQTGGVVEREFGIQAGSLRDISSAGNPAGTIRQDYDPASGAVGDVFVSGQTIIVKLYYETADPTPTPSGGERTETFNTAGAGTWTVPAGVTSVAVAFADASGYGVNYWVELVRSSSSGSIVESATGDNIWLRTSDGEPLEQQGARSAGETWHDNFYGADTAEPDIIRTISNAREQVWRAQKTGEAWLPSASGIRLRTIPWGGHTTYRVYDNAFNFGALTANGELTVTPGDTIAYRVGDGSITLTYSTGPAAPSFADDTGDAQTWERGTAITQIVVPAASGNPKPTYAAQGALPAGITYTAPGASDDHGGTIQGTPTALGSGTITIRATNTQGNDDWTVAFETRAPPPAGVLETVVGDGGTSGTLAWNPRPRPLIPASLVDGGGAAYLDQVSINSIGDYSLQTASSASGGSGFTAGPELTSRWENYAEALTISASNVEIVIPGPNFAGFTRRDTSEPYSWSSPSSGSYRDRVNAFFAAYRALSQAARNQTRVEMRDRPKLQAPAVAIAAVASTPETAGSITLAATLTGGVYTGDAVLAWEVRTGTGTVVKSGDLGAIYSIVNILADEAVTIRATVTVQGTGGATATAFGEVSFTVTAVKTAPRPVIGTAAQTIRAGATLQLAATDSDPGGVIVTRAWSAQGGAGTFDDAAIAGAQWTAPYPLLDTAYVLTYSVTDDDGQSASATVVITVQSVSFAATPAAGAPTARANLDGPTTLSARASANAPTAAADLGGPTTLGARPAAGAPTARGRPFGPLAARPEAGAPSALARLAEAGLRAYPSAGRPTARLAIPGRTALSARPAAGTPTEAAHLGGPITLSARPSADPPMSRMPALSKPLSGRPDAGAPTARAVLGGPITVAARPSAGAPTAFLLIPQSIKARPSAGRPTARLRMSGPVTLSARPSAGAPRAVFSSEAQVFPTPLTPATGLPEHLSARLQAVTRPDLAGVLRTLAGIR